jgi:hypothetical protein
MRPQKRKTELGERKRTMRIRVVVNQTPLPRRPNQNKLYRNIISPRSQIRESKVGETHTRLLFPFPSSTKFLVYPRLRSANAYWHQCSSCEIYSSIRSRSCRTSTSLLVRPEEGPRILEMSTTSLSKGLDGVMTEPAPPMDSCAIDGVMILVCFE